MRRSEVWTRSIPEGGNSGQGDGGGLVACELLVAGGYEVEVFEAVERRFDAPALAVAALVVADPSLAAAHAWDDRRDAMRPQVGSQPVGIVALVGGQAADLT